MCQVRRNARVIVFQRFLPCARSSLNCASFGGSTRFHCRVSKKSVTKYSREAPCFTTSELERPFSRPTAKASGQGNCSSCQWRHSQVRVPQHVLHKRSSSSVPCNEWGRVLLVLAARPAGFQATSSPDATVPDAAGLLFKLRNLLSFRAWRRMCAETTRHRSPAG